ncbi:hypothetical protein GCM10023176_62410 [Micromonospora coerulea]|uniref:Uncharacterized protein n=1 Tax=Micromonospora coerulea TaxID=47856 RepID=A0ABP8T4S4_9ACTN
MRVTFSRGAARVATVVAVAAGGVLATASAALALPVVALSDLRLKRRLRVGGAPLPPAA